MAKPILCFDLDGTIVSSTEVHVKALQQAFGENSLPLVTDEQIIKAYSKGMTARQLIKQLYPTISDRKLETTTAAKYEAVENNFYNLTKPILGVPEALVQLKSKYLLALVSNSTHKTILALLKGADISSRLFDLIIGAEDVSRPKPAPDEINLAEKKLKSKVEYLIGDTITDIRAGKNAGIKTIAVLSGSGEINELLTEKPTIVLQSAALLPEILMKASF